MSLSAARCQDVEFSLKLTLVLKQHVRLQHRAPFSIHPDYRIYFLTICADERGINKFAKTDTFNSIQEASVQYNEDNRWWTSLLLAMPDHLHLITSIPDTESLARTVGYWKRHLTRLHGMRWQRNFFDHRLRNEESARNKADYILANPVRAGLVEKPQEWPYVWTAE